MDIVSFTVSTATTLALAVVSALFLAVFLNASKLFTNVGNSYSNTTKFIREKVFTDNTFFWLVTFVFMAVSVAESGDFFNAIIRNNILGILGYASAFVIDLVAVTSMKARLRAIRMRDKKGEHLYLFGVWVCAGISSFANVTTALSGYSENAFPHAPHWIQFVSPWIGIAFPLLIVLISITADHVLDENPADKVKDLETYKEQEQKRVKIFEIRQGIEEDLLKLEKRIETTIRERGEIVPKREFIVWRWLFREKQMKSKNQVDVEATFAQFRQLHEQQNAYYTNQFQDLHHTLHEQALWIANCMQDTAAKQDTDEVFKPVLNEVILPVSRNVQEVIVDGYDSPYFEWASVANEPLHIVRDEMEIQKDVEPDEEVFESTDETPQNEQQTEGLPAIHMMQISSPEQKQKTTHRAVLSRSRKSLRRSASTKRTKQVDVETVKAFISAEREAGREPSISQIVDVTKCSNGTASKYKNQRSLIA